MNYLKEKIRYSLLKIPFGRLIWQFGKAIFSLRFKSYRNLFFYLKNDDICLDLGANVGSASLIMWLRGVKSIYALEPNPEVFKVLNENTKGIKNCFTIKKAISNETNIQKLYLHEKIKKKSEKRKLLEFSQVSSLMENKTNIGKCFFKVESVTFDDLLKNLNISPSIVKCDIEGGEYIIYEQLINYAKNSSVRKMFIECHAKKYSQYLPSHNKFLYLIKKNNLEEIFDIKWH